MKFLLHLFAADDKRLLERGKSYYYINRDGVLELDRDALLKSGKMKSQLKAAQNLRRTLSRTDQLPTE